jgi:cytidine deaminase
LRTIRSAAGHPFAPKKDTMITEITYTPASRLQVGAHVTAHALTRHARINSLDTVYEVTEHAESSAGIWIVLTSANGERRHLNVTGSHLFYLADPQ